MLQNEVLQSRLLEHIVESILLILLKSLELELEVPMLLKLDLKLVLYLPVLNLHFFNLLPELILLALNNRPAFLVLLETLYLLQTLLKRSDQSLLTILKLENLLFLPLFY